MPTATYQQLYDAVLPAVSDAVEAAAFGKEAGIFSRTVAKNGVKEAPGLFRRFADVFTGRTSKEMTRNMNEFAEQRDVAQKGLREANDTIADLRAGSQRDATREWLDTTGGRLATGVGLTGVVAAPAMYGVGQMQGRKNKKRTRNVAFGSGLATGLAAPGMVNAGMARLQQAQLPQPHMPQQHAPQPHMQQGY